MAEKQDKRKTGAREYTLKKEHIHQGERLGKGDKITLPPDLADWLKSLGVI